MHTAHSTAEQKIMEQIRPYINYQEKLRKYSTFGGTSEKRIENSYVFYWKVFILWVGVIV